MSIVYLNGTFMNSADARISPMDRGFLFGDGVYEVVPVFNGRPLRLHEHLRRLEHSLDELRIARPMTREQIAALFFEMIERNGGGDLTVYMQVTRGSPAKRDHAFPVPLVAPTVFVTTARLAKTEVDEPEHAVGSKAIVAEDIRWLRCDIKSVALLASVLMRQRAAEAGAAETIMVRGGWVTEGSSTNVFVVKQQRIATPPLSPLILGGITRALVLELARGLGLLVAERQIAAAELNSADEIWVTSSTKDMLPIVTLNSRPVGGGRPGPVWQAVARGYLQYKQQVCAIEQAAVDITT